VQQHPEHALTAAYTNAAPSLSSANNKLRHASKMEQARASGLEPRRHRVPVRRRQDRRTDLYRAGSDLSKRASDAAQEAQQH
jgi:hypothetical protein